MSGNVAAYSKYRGPVAAQAARVIARPNAGSPFALISWSRTMRDVQGVKRRRGLLPQYGGLRASGAVMCGQQRAPQPYPAKLPHGDFRERVLTVRTVLAGERTPRPAKAAQLRVVARERAYGQLPPLPPAGASRKRAANSCPRRFIIASLASSTKFVVATPLRDRPILPVPTNRAIGVAPGHARHARGHCHKTHGRHFVDRC